MFELVCLLVVAQLATGGPPQQTVSEASPSETESSPPSSLADARELLRTGEYFACREAAYSALERAAAEARESSGLRRYMADGEAWRLLKLAVELRMGDYHGAVETLEEALEVYPRSIRLRWHGIPAYRHNDMSREAKQRLDEIDELVRRAPWRYGDPEDGVVYGRHALHLGVDARRVLEEIYDVAKKKNPDLPDAFIAAGDLALSKHDYGVATEEFERALKLDDANPDLHFRLAMAKAAANPAEAEAHLATTLERNPRHSDALLFLADSAIDREAYDEAREHLDAVLAVNRRHSLAHAYRAVLAHLAGDVDAERAARAAALATWSANPEVDHLIGRKLSQKYRFAEGAAAQRRALEFDHGYLPAKVQLCQDLLRLGQEDEGWKLANEVQEEDGYNVVAYNLGVLHDHLSAFRSLESDGFVLRMERGEASVYGDRALDLLHRAKRALCAKYDVEIERPVIVEIFPEQKDFAIRTFGLPGGAGFLGVCFGTVITANSPASQGESPSNWEAVLWHEFCHVVTLQKTRNKMPRWLSEGISVYEERLEDPVWGQTMTPTYLEIINDGGLTPVAELSGAFLRPPSPLHLQFAYYQSSLVVEFVIEKYGLDALKDVLDDLGEGTTINAALQRATGSLAELEDGFKAFAQARASTLAARADWSKPEYDEPTHDAVDAWLESHPRSFWALQARALLLMRDARFREALAPIEKLIELHPNFSESANGLELLARAQRELGNRKAEREALERLAAISADDVATFLRLIELSEEHDAIAVDHESMALNAQRLIAVNPLLRAPHRALARSAVARGDDDAAIQAYRALLALGPLDPAEAHFQLARALRRGGKLEDAKRQLLSAIAEAPRFRAALEELLAVHRELKHGREERQETPEGAPKAEENDG